jgi:hypothetical protein
MESLFPFRFWRLYRFFLSGTIYRDDPKPRLSALEYAWRYARSGGDA